MDIHGVRYPQGWVSISIRRNDVQIQISVDTPKEAARIQGQMFQVIDELQDLIDASKVLPNTRI